MANHYIVLFIASIIGVPLLISPTVIPITHAQSNTTNQSNEVVGNNTGGINAQNVYQTRMMTFGNNVKNLVILLPNEGHESPALPKDQRIINQPYVPQNIIVSPDTNIIWLNGDVGHKHTITLLDESSNQVYSSKFDSNTVTSPLVLNKTGKFTYSEAKVNKDDPKFVMDGTITVSENPSTDGNSTPDTVAFFMVPAKDLDKHVSELTNKGVDVLDKYTFKDLRGGQKGTGTEQTLLILGTKGDQSQLISTLQNIAATLPYS